MSARFRVFSLRLFSAFLKATFNRFETGGLLGLLCLLLGFGSAGTASAQAVNFYSQFTSFSQSAVVYGNGIAADANANLYLTGNYNLGYIPREGNGNYGSFLSPRIDTVGGGAYGLAIDSANNVYRVDISNNWVAKYVYEGVNQFTREYIASNGSVTAAASSTWSAPSAIAVDSVGDIYVLNSGSGAIVKLTPSGAVYTATTVYTGATLVNAAGLSLDSAGDFYFTTGPHTSALTGLASNSSPGVYRLSPGCNSYCQSSLGSGWASPADSAVDAAGNVWVADHDAGEIYLLAPSGGNYTQMPWASVPTVSRLTISNYGQLFAMTDGSSGNSVVWIGGTAPHNLGSAAVGFSSTPVAVVVSFASEVTSASYSVVTQGAPGKDFIDAGGGTCGRSTSYSAGSSCTINIEFSPTSPGVREGALVIKDGNGRTVATNYLYGTGLAPLGLFTTATQTLGISLPTYPNPGLRGISLDGYGNLYALETATGSLDEFSAGSTTPRYLATGFATSGGGGTAVDGAGNVFFSCTTCSGYPGNSIFELVGGTGAPVKVATIDTNGSSMDDNLEIDGAGNLYTSSWGGGAGAGAIYEISSGSYQVTTLVAGGAGHRFIGIGSDAAGDLFVGDFNNNILYEVPAGTGKLVPLVTGGYLNNPHGVAVDPAGNVYVSNYNGGTVIRYAAGSYVATLLPAAGQRGIALDGAGNLYTITTDSTIAEYARTTAPTLTFPNTQVDASASSGNGIVFENDGNADLVISDYTASAPFSAGGSSNTCVVGNMRSGGSCVIGAEFAPSAVGAVGGAITITDNTLGRAGAQQEVPLAGTGVPGTKYIDFPSLASPVTVNSTATLAAYATNGDPVVYTITAGVASISGNTVAFTDSGLVTIEANSPATANYAAAEPVSQTVQVVPASALYTVPSIAVAATTPVQTATVNFTSGGVLGSIAVLTQGAIGKGFNVAPGGTCTAGTTYLAGQACTVNYTFTPHYPGVRAGAIELISSTGALLGTSTTSGTGTGPEMVFAPTAAPVTLGSGFAYPSGVAVDGNGNVWVADTNHGMVKEITTANGVSSVRTVASGFSGPAQLALDGAGNVYVSDNGDSKVEELIAVEGNVPSNPTILMLGGGFTHPTGIAVDRTGNVYVADNPTDASNNSAPLVKEIPAGCVSANCVLNLGAVSGPEGLAVDSKGDIYIANGNNHSRAVYELAAVNGQVPVNSTAILVTSIGHPYGAAVDAAGDLYIADYNNSAVYRVLAVNGTIPANPTVQTLWSGLTNPEQLAVDAAGNIYVANTNASQVITLTTGAPSLNMGSTSFGVSSAVHTVIAGNIGNAPLLITGYTATAPFSVSNPSNTCTTGTLAEGATCLVGATFTPDAIGAASGTVTVTDNSLYVAGAAQTIALSGTATQGSQTITFGALAPVTFGTGPIALSATGGASGNPVTFSVVSGPASISENMLTVTGAGSIVVAANQAASADYMAAPQATQTLFVYKAVKSITFPALSSPMTVNSVATLAAATSNGDPVVYSITSGAASINGTTVTFTNAGSVTIQADSPASANYLAAASLAQTVVVNPAPIAYAAPNTPVGSSSAVQMATVNFTAGGTLGSISVVTQGAEDLDFKVAAGGTCIVGVAYSAGEACTVNYTFTPTRPGLRSGAIVLSEVSSSPLGTSYLSGIGRGPQIQFSSNTAQVAVGSGITHPTGIWVDADGSVYVTDFNAGNVDKIAAVNGRIPTSPTVTVLASNISEACGVAVDGAGNVFAVSAGSGTVVEIPYLAGTYGSPITLQSGIGYSCGITLDVSGNVYFAQQATGYVRKIYAVNGTVTANSPVTVLASGMNQPQGLAVDPNGDVYVANFSGYVQQIPYTNGSYGQPVSFGPYVGRIWGLALDGMGNLYVTTGGNAGVTEILGVDGNLPFNNQTVRVLGANFGDARSVAVDGGGNLFVDDFNHQQVTELDLADAPSLSFPTTALEESSSPAPFTISNYGSDVLVLSGYSTGSSNFRASGVQGSAAACSAGVSLVPGSSCGMTVEFAPIVAGNPDMDSVTLSDNSLNVANGTQAVNLSGVAIQQTPGIIVAAASTDYASPSTLLSASVSFQGGTAPTGAVTFSVDGGASVAATCAGTGSSLNCTASYPTSTLSVPTHTIRVSLASDANFTAASGTATLTVNPIAPSISFTVANHTYGNASFALSATSNSTGSITYSVVSGPAAIIGNTLTIRGAGNVTVQASQAANGNYTAGAQNASFTVSQAQLGVTIQGTPTKTYDGTASAALMPANFAVTGLVGSDSIAVNQTSGIYAAASAGSENVTATLAAANYVAVSGSLNNYILPNSAAGAGFINQALASVTVNPSTKVYGTADPTFTGTLIGFVASDNVTASYTRTAGETVLGGPYTISATLAPAAVLGNYKITYNTALFTITPAPASFTFGNLVQTYTSGPLAPTVATTPAGVSYTVTGAPRIAAGSYLVTATVTDPNYTGSGSTSFTIQRAPATIALSNLSQVYSSNALAATATVAPAYCGPATLTYDGSATAPSNIGTYAVMATEANPNCTAPNATGTLIVNAFAASSCVYALSPTAHGAFSVSGGATMNAQCSIQVNSAARDAFDVDGSKSTVDATAISVVGGAAVDRFATVSSKLAMGQPAAADPLAAVLAPTVGACVNTGDQDGGNDNHGSKSITLNPGTYCGGINIHGNSAVTFNPGTYILLGGGLNIDGGAHVAGAGVTFYNTSDRTHRYAPIQIDGHSTATLSAPVSGSLAGVLFFQDRGIGQNQDRDNDADRDQNGLRQPNKIAGGSESTFTGALYFPTTPLMYSGGSDQDPAAYTLIVADIVSLSGGSSSQITVLGTPMTDKDSDACGTSTRCGPDVDRGHGNTR